MKTALAALAISLVAGTTQADIKVWKIESDGITLTPVTTLTWAISKCSGGSTSDIIATTSAQFNCPTNTVTYIELDSASIDAAESDNQAGDVWNADTILPPAYGYVIRFTHDVGTWDSYSNFGVGFDGLFDIAMANVNQQAEVRLLLSECGVGIATDSHVTPLPGNQLPIPAPVIDASGTELPGVTWAFGGDFYDDGNLDYAWSNTSTEIRLEGDDEQSYYVSFVIDTVADSQNSIFPTWAIFGSPVSDVTTTNTNPGDPGYGLPDRTVDGADLSYFQALWLSADPKADLTTTIANPCDPDYGISDGSVNGADLSYFVEHWLSAE